MTFGNETVSIFALHQRRCAKLYGETNAAGTCQAKLGGTGTHKCSNTIATCQDSVNYSEHVVTLYFSRPQEGINKHYGYVIPSIASMQTAPAKINLAAMNRNAKPLGEREQLTVKFVDHRHSGLTVDEYRLERAYEEAIRWGSYSTTARHRVGFARSMFGGGVLRSMQRVARTEFFQRFRSAWDPYNRGTFWGRFLAANPYYESFECTHYEGVMGQPLEEMRARRYVVNSIDGASGGIVTLVAKDLFSKIERRKAQAPFPSLGELSADMTGSPGTFSVLPGGVGNLTPEEGGYNTIDNVVQGYVCIGDEIIRVTRVGNTFTVLERNALNTIKADHKSEDLVQLVLVYSAQHVEDIAYDLFTNYSYVPAANIDKVQWDLIGTPLTDLYTIRIAKPRPVMDLIGELSEQSGVTFFPDVATGMIEMVPLRAADIEPVVDDRSYIREDSLTIRRDASQRVSSVWVFYGMRNPTDDPEDETNYHSRIVITNPTEADRHGSDVVRKVFGTFIPQFGRQQAERTGDRVLALFTHPPVQAEFKIDALSRDGELELARYFYLKVAELQDELGNEIPTAMATIALHRTENEIGIEAQGIAFAPDPETAENVIRIENDGRNFVLRDIYDSIFATPTGSETIIFIIEEDIQVGSDSVSLPSMRTGKWPAMTTKPKIINKGRVQGKGGLGGAGGFAFTPGTGISAGGAGQDGGDALLVEAPFDIDNSLGEIWAGGGGAGGGGGGMDLHNFHLDALGGGAGSPGAGNTPTPGSAGGWVSGTHHSQAGQDSSASTTESPGTGGIGANNTEGAAGHGGTGGAPGQPGSAGTTAGTDGGQGAGGAAGLAGRYISGIANVTFVGAPGDLRGRVD